MTADSRTPPPEAEIESPTPPPRRRRRWKWVVIAFAVLIAAPVLAFTLWTWIALSYTYSTGDRTGYVQKFSQRGWICKTYEGELAMVTAPGQLQEKWLFTVRNDSVANAIRQTMGNEVGLIYEEHHGVPSSCFGDTQYFVTGVRKVHQP